MDISLQLILTALGNAILNSFWQMGLIWFLLLLNSKFNKSLSPSALSRLSFSGLLTGLILFLSTFIISLTSPRLQYGLFTWMEGSSLFKIPFLFYIAIIYLLVLVMPLVKFVLGINNVRHLKRNNISKVPGHFKLFVVDSCQYLNIKRKVKIFTSNIIHSPLTIGFLKPVILLPAVMLNQLSMQQVEAVILHELAHIKRNDYLQNLISHIILTIFYFNPFAKLIVGIQSVEREKSADKWVLQFGYNNHMYATTLLHLAKQNVLSQTDLAIQVSGKRNSLTERVEWIFGREIRRYPSAKNILLLLTIILAAFGISNIHNNKGAIKTHVEYGSDISLVSAIAPLYKYDAPSVASLLPVDFFDPAKKEEMAIKQKNKTAKKTASINKKTARGFAIIDGAPETEPTILPAVTYASNATVSLPELATIDEKNINNALATAKKIMVDLGWKEIENALAETITSGDKNTLKEIFTQKINASDWQSREDLLRLYYKKIDWKKANEKLIAMLAAIKADSIYHNCQSLVQELSKYKKTINVKSIENKTLIDSLNKKLQFYNTVIQRIDSVKHKAIVEL